MGFVAELVALNNFAGSIDSTDRIARNTQYLGGLGRAYAPSFCDVHVTPQCLRVISRIRCAVAVMLGFAADYKK